MTTYEKTFSVVYAAVIAFAVIVLVMDFTVWRPDVKTAKVSQSCQPAHSIQARTSK